MCKDGNGKYWLFCEFMSFNILSHCLILCVIATGVGIEIRTSTDRTAWTYVGLVWPNGAPSATNTYTGTSNGWVARFLTSTNSHSILKSSVGARLYLRQWQVPGELPSSHPISLKYLICFLQLFYAASTFGSQKSGIFYATSSTGAPGSWTDNGLVISTSSSSNYNAIDPK
jgi:arabinan endo-1,5-alpha-L-arabinosidase